MDVHDQMVYFAQVQSSLTFFYVVLQYVNENEVRALKGIKNLDMMILNKLKVCWLFLLISLSIFKEQPY